MKVLHIGEKGNIEKYAAGNPYLSRLEIIDMPRGLTDLEYLSRAKDAEYIVADAISRVSADLIAGMPNLRMIHSEGVAFDQIDTEEAARRGVFVCSSQGMNASAVAEQTILLMVGMLRDVVNGDQAVRDGRQIQVKGGYIRSGSLRELSDCTVGLIGFGSIGRQTAHLLKAYGTRNILYYKRHPLPKEQEERYGVQYRPLDELLGQSDIVSLHVPVTHETEYMADFGFFSKMKQGAYFVNTSRGELVEDDALIHALASGKLAMAGLDTLDCEPVQKDHVLLEQPREIARRILFSPHIGGITGASFTRSMAMVLEDIRIVEEGGIPERTVKSPQGTR
ncbi:MAG: NAD(P)-dependent oxidoreductase [Bilifractor sp.]